MTSTHLSCTTPGRRHRNPTRPIRLEPGEARLQDAAAHVRVNAKTLSNWIAQGLVPGARREEPPYSRNGVAQVIVPLARVVEVAAGRRAEEAAKAARRAERQAAAARVAHANAVHAYEEECRRVAATPAPATVTTTTLEPWLTAESSGTASPAA